MTRYRQTLMAVCLSGEFDTSSTAATFAPLRSMRRTVLARQILLALILVAGLELAHASSLVPQTQLNGLCVPQFQVPLPVFGPAGSIPRVDAVVHPSLTVTMKEIDQAVLPQGFFKNCGITLGKTRVWAYETSDTNTGAILGPASWPATTIVTQRGTATRVEYVNTLPSFNPSDPTGPGLVQGVLEFDQTLHWANPLQTGCGMQIIQCSQPGRFSLAKGPFRLDDFKPLACGRTMAREGRYMASSYTMASFIDSTSPCCQQYIGPVPAAVHLHGAELASHFDGDPNSWFTPDGLYGPSYYTLGNPGPGKAIYEYPNSQDAGTLWFHDHTLGVTRLNVYAGMAGFYLLRDAATTPKDLPTGAYEAEMVVQDRLFDTNSQLYFPSQTPVADHPFWGVVFEGDVATVNGAAFPYMNVEPRRYLFHILNGCNNRQLILSFGDAPAYQVGADDSYYDKPIAVSKVTLGPAERADVIVDFSKLKGQNITVINTGFAERYLLPRIMQFRVQQPLKSSDTSCDPATSCMRATQIVRLTDDNGNVLPGVKIDKVRQLVINELFDYPTNIEEFVNNTLWDGLKSPGIALEFPSDGISELPRVGSIEEWDIVNIYSPGTAFQSHPIHIHLAQFQVLNRQDINTNSNGGYLGAWSAAFGQGPAPLPSNCTAGQTCYGYGPPLSYDAANAEGAVGGNPPIGAYLSGSVIPPESGEQGWKDTAVSYGRQVLRLLIRWTPNDVPVIPNQSYAGQNLLRVRSYTGLLCVALSPH